MEEVKLENELKTFFATLEYINRDAVDYISKYNDFK